jgi:hypothetical protein
MVVYFRDGSMKTWEGVTQRVVMDGVMSFTSTDATGKQTGVVLFDFLGYEVER